MLPSSLTIRPTEHFFMLGEVMVRAWVTDDRTLVFVAAVAGAAGATLIEIPPPDAEAQQRWAAKIMEGDGK